MIPRADLSQAVNLLKKGFDIQLYNGWGGEDNAEDNTEDNAEDNAEDNSKRKNTTFFFKCYFKCI